ncbi:DMT family transporter [Pseudothermotoga thermarum]|uniref:DMT family transporter n=1 Tax=Pseudothermotoga thermarum TaxID=119394 RepID=UPI00059E9181
MPLTVVFSGVAVSLIFGLSFLFTKNAIEYIDVYTFLSYRFAVALCFVQIIWMIKSKQHKVSTKYYKLIPLAIFQPILYFTFEINGLKLTSSAEAGMLIALIPIMVNLLAYLFLKEHADWLHYLLVLISFVGAVLIIGFEITSQNFLGKILLMGAVLSAGFYNILSRKFSREFSPLQITHFMMLVGFVYFTTFSLIMGRFKIVFHPQVLISALYLGALSSTVAFFLVNYMISKASPIFTSLFSNLTTVVSVIAGVIFRNEKIMPTQILGMILILTSLTFVTIKGTKNPKIKEV